MYGPIIDTSLHRSKIQLLAADLKFLFQINLWKFLELCQESFGISGPAFRDFAITLWVAPLILHRQERPIVKLNFYE